MSDAQTTTADTAAPEEPEDKVVYKLKLDLDSPAKGESVQIAGLGTFENGATHNITESQHELFRRQNSTFEDVVDPDTNALLAVNNILGPTLLEAFKDRDGVTVTTARKGGSS